MTSEPYRILIEQSPDGMVIAQDNVITFANAAAARLCGAANEHALIGRPLLEIFVPSGTSGRAIRMQRFARAAAGEHVAPFEDQLDQPDGGACDVEIAVAHLALLESQSPAIMLAMREISERKRAEAALRESEERLTLAFAGA